MFFVDPLYPYFLGVVYTFVGHDLLVVRLIQMLIGVATVGSSPTSVGGSQAGRSATQPPCSTPSIRP